MSLTKFGETVRSLRREAKLTLLVMASDLEASPAFLSAMETGRSKVPEGWVKRIADYFDSKGMKVNHLELKQYADVANQTVPISSLPVQHQMLVAGFASSELNQDQLKKFASLLAEIYGDPNDKHVDT